MGFSSTAALGSATIIIQNTDAAGQGFNDPTAATPVGGNPGTTVGAQRLNAFAHAANIWGQTLTSGPTIVIRASWPDLACTATSGTLGSAGAVSFRSNFAGAPFNDTWYNAALANALSNNDSSSNAEISAQFNAKLGTPGCLETLTWYYGLDTNNLGNQVNLVTVLLHEFAHGLGFSASPTNTATGAQLNGLPSIYERFLLDNVSGKTWNQMTDAERVASGINTGNLVWNGAQSTADSVILGNGKDPQGHPLMYAPNPRVAGSSVSHWSNVLSPNQLMEPNNSFGLTHSVRTPQDLTFSLLRDVGWCSGCPQPPPPSPTPTPTPPSNNDFGSAQVLSGCSGSVTGTNVGATKESGEPAHLPVSSGSARSVWYQWQAPSTGSVTITTENSDYDTILAVYTGSSLGGLSLVGNDDDSGPGTTSSLTFAATAGVTYRIAVDGYDNDSGGDTGNIRLNWSQSNCTTPPPSNTVAFNSMPSSVGEGAASYQILVSRTDTTGVASVNYSTSDTAGLNACGVNNGVASERCDYATTVGTLRFAAGETTKTITVPVINDAHIEGNETFTIALSGPVGTSLGSPNSVVIIIADDDTSQSAQNPIDGVDPFITQQYVDFLGRLPDAGGFANWKATLGGCPNGGFGEFDNPSCDRVHVSAGFFLSDEFRGRGYWAYRFYEVGFDRRPTYNEFVPDMSKVGGAQSPESEVLSKAQYTTDFGLRQEFINRYGAMSDEAYVNALEQQAEITLTNKQAMINSLATGTSRVQLLRNIVESQAVEDRFFIRAFVAMQYFGYLRRDPDTVGYNNWVSTLTANPADFRHMIFGFIYSAEYRLRFGPQ